MQFQEFRFKEQKDPFQAYILLGGEGEILSFKTLLDQFLYK